MKKLKYIRMFYSGFVVFSDAVLHSKIAPGLVCPGDFIKSAGFIASDTEGKLCCYGKSVSLLIESLPEDTQLLREFLHIT